MSEGGIRGRCCLCDVAVRQDLWFRRTLSLEQSVDRPQTATLVAQLIPTVAENVFV